MLTELQKNVIHQYAAQWENLGILLEVEDSHITDTARNNHNQSVNACAEMLTKWLQAVPSPTWGKLQDSINSLNKIMASKPSGMYFHTCIHLLCYIILIK